MATKKSTDLKCIETLNSMRFQGVELSVSKFNSIFRKFMKAASIDYQSAKIKKGKALVYLAVTSAQVIYLERMEIDVKVMRGLAVGQNACYWPIWDISLADSQTIDERITSSAGHIGLLAD